MLTGAIVVVPLAPLAAGVWLGWGHAVTLTDILLALALHGDRPGRDDGGKPQAVLISPPDVADYLDQFGQLRAGD